mmetsp:Transcript_45776/g.127006  ORF Transcript_45776/g.127006 Transcript_45776/m.127006 type:complete len:241 (-) Transcript_45776:750-1472(-)
MVAVLDTLNRRGQAFARQERAPQLVLLHVPVGLHHLRLGSVPRGGEGGDGGRALQRGLPRHGLRLPAARDEALRRRGGTSPRRGDVADGGTRQLPRAYAEGVPCNASHGVLASRRGQFVRRQGACTQHAGHGREPSGADPRRFVPGANQGLALGGGVPAVPRDRAQVAVADSGTRWHEGGLRCPIRRMPLRGTLGVALRIRPHRRPNVAGRVRRLRLVTYSCWRCGPARLPGRAGVAGVL